MTAPATLTHRLVARNDAVTSENPIHHDDVAPHYGFASGLVPGVTVYGYLCWPPASRWGLDWVAGGTISARFIAPVYDGDEVTVRAIAEDERTLELAVLTGDDHVCATGVATLPAQPAARPDLARFPTRPVPAPEDRPPASEAVLAARGVGAVERTWGPADRAWLLDLLRDDLGLYDDARIAHPGGLIRAANDVLSRSVRLGPWIHVASTTTHHRSVPDGTTVVTRGVVTDLYERKGHRFVALDVMSAIGDDPVLSVRHVAIYEPRRRDGAGG